MAIIQRGIRRYFIDIYFLIKELGLEKIFEITKKKYPSFNFYLAIQSLTFFDDAEKEKVKRIITYIKSVNWIGIKKFLIKTINDFKRTHLK